MRPTLASIVALASLFVLAPTTGHAQERAAWQNLDWQPEHVNLNDSQQAIADGVVGRWRLDVEATRALLPAEFREEMPLELEATLELRPIGSNYVGVAAESFAYPGRQSENIGTWSVMGVAEDREAIVIRVLMTFDGGHSALRAHAWLQEDGSLVLADQDVPVVDEVLQVFRRAED